MKKGLLVVSIVAVVIALLGFAGYAFAAGQNWFVNRDANTSYVWTMNGRGVGPGMMVGPNDSWYGYGMMGPYWNESGPMYKYMLNAMAKALDITPEDLQSQLNSGTNPWQIAQKKGMTTEQFQQAMVTGMTEALKQAVTDGVITQALADLMIQHMQAMDFGFGYNQGGFPRMGPGGRRMGPRP